MHNALIIRLEEKCEMSIYISAHKGIYLYSPNNGNRQRHAKMCSRRIDKQRKLRNHIPQDLKVAVFQHQVHQALNHRTFRQQSSDNIALDCEKQNSDYVWTCAAFGHY